MIRKLAGISALLGLITVILGAFGAHSLKEKLDAEALKNFETGTRYMMYHILAILLIVNTGLIKEKSKIIISGFFLAGILFFSGSIFAISLDLVQAKQIWFVTPLGGLFFIIGWLISALSFFNFSDKN
ncbi:MAG: DUF423 domain-containing protein [Flavobacteriales bacterium]|nr:DUF423 domain-containing protein [Flavobacteriales bacterium]